MDPHGASDRFSEATLREPLRRALARRVLVRAAVISGAGAAVLVPLFEHEGEVHVWLLRRSAELRRHAGQVGFPGGKTDPADATPLATALREADEEIGLHPDSVDVLGRLDDLVTGTGFTVAPFVGWLTAPFVPIPNGAEVARVFHGPLRLFMQKPRGIPPFHGHTVDGELVWGVTGRIVASFVKVLRELEGR